MAKGKKAGNKKKYNGLIKKKKNKEQQAKEKRVARLKELNSIDKEATKSN